MTHRHHRSRGFTLIEALVSMAIAAIVISGVVATANLQTQSSAVGTRQRMAQVAGRNALLYMEQRIALAGFGIDPVFAFDFTRAVTPCPAELAPCSRDSQTNSDELVFYARNPAYWVPLDTSHDPAGAAWRIVGTSANDVTVSARAGDTFRLGQVVLEICSGGAFYAYATIAANVPALAAAGNQVLSLKAVDATDPFRRQDLSAPPATGASCFSGGTARLFLVDRYRFHVRPVATDGGGLVPYLMLGTGTDQNLDGTIDEDDELVIAEGVENLQVGYLFANPALPTQVAGVTGPITYVSAAAGMTTVANHITTTLFPGANPATGQSVYSSSSFYGISFDSPVPAARLTDHQVNIRAVQFSLVTRSPGTDRSSPGDTFLPLNMTSQPAWITSRQVGGRDGYQRALLESTVQAPNMLSGALTYY
jgi:type IV pilus assembly protein PilW